MSVLEMEYQGDDLIISKEVAEKELGLHPGDRLEIRPKMVLMPVDRLPEEITEIERACELLRQAFEPDDLADWEISRKAMWATWQPPI